MSPEKLAIILTSSTEGRKMGLVVGTLLGEWGPALAMGHSETQSPAFPDASPRTMLGSAAHRHPGCKNSVSMR